MLGKAPVDTDVRIMVGHAEASLGTLSQGVRLHRTAQNRQSGGIDLRTLASADCYQRSLVVE